MYRYLIVSDKGYNSGRLGTWYCKNVARFVFYQNAVRLSCRRACKLSCVAWKTFSRAIINQFSGQVKLFVIVEVLYLRNSNDNEKININLTEK